MAGTNALLELVNVPESEGKAIGPFSNAAVVDGHLIYLSGILGITPAGELADSLEAQLQQLFVNLKNVLRAAKSDLKHVVKCNVYLMDMNDFGKMNEIYAKEFDGHKPARTTIQVAKLPRDGKVEIEAVAVVAQ